MPDTALKAIKNYLSTLEEKGVVELEERIKVADEIRELSAKLLSARPSEIALVKNTSSGIIIALSSIPWSRGDNVIIMEDPFPANFYPWVYLLPEVEKRFVKLGGGEGFMLKVLKAIDKKTKAISLDFVHFLTGYKIEVEEISKVCEERGIFFILDAIQGLGAIRLEAKGIDFIASGASKWLLGPQGIGILYISKEILPKLKFANIGWFSAKWKDFERLFPFPSIKEGASRIEEGTLNPFGLYGLRESLKLINSIGIEEIEKRILTLKMVIQRGLLEKGYEVISPKEKERSSGIVSFKAPRELFLRLKSKGVICSFREGYIRFSPHFFNTQEEIEILLSYL